MVLEAEWSAADGAGTTESCSISMAGISSRWSGEAPPAADTSHLASHDCELALVPPSCSGSRARAELGPTIALETPREVIRIGCDGSPGVTSQCRYPRPTSARSAPSPLSSRSLCRVSRTRSSRLVCAPIAWRPIFASDSRNRFVKQRRWSHQGHRSGSGGRIDHGSLEIQVDKRSYPWKVQVKGVRQIVGETGSGETFELALELVRASREEHLEGLLVWGIRAKGDPIDSVLASATAQGGMP